MTKYVRSGNHKRVSYHTDKDCMTVRHELREATENEIEAFDMDECKVCAGEVTPGEIELKKECPLCGEIVGKLPPHIENDH